MRRVGGGGGEYIIRSCCIVKIHLFECRRIISRVSEACAVELCKEQCSCIEEAHGAMDSCGVSEQFKEIFGEITVEGTHTFILTGYQVIQRVQNVQLLRWLRLFGGPSLR